MFNKIIVWTLFVSALAIASARLSCIDSSHNSLAWFNILKYPSDMTTRVPRYAYLDAHSGATFQVIQGAHSDDQNQPLFNTIERINSIPHAERNVILFNDEPPTTPPNSRGAHAKGIIAFDSGSQTGVYILHSMPKFPSVTAENNISPKIPQTALKYGQHIYCISLNREILSHLLQNLPIKKPTVYYATGLFKTLPAKAADKFLINQFHLLNGDDQWFLTKNPNYPGFLFEDIIIPHFKISLATESWGRPYQGPHCEPSFKSLNIQTVAITREDSWGHTKDHSKWTISTEDSGFEIACLCDMNRMNSQASRGGSCLCSRNHNLYHALKSVIRETDHC